MAGIDLVVGLDIGTSKVGVVVAEINGSLWPKLLGLGVAPVAGIRCGMVVDLLQATRSIKRAIQDAELMSGIKVSKVVAGLSGEHIKCFLSRGVVGLNRLRQEISATDVQRVLEAARLVNLPADRQLLHVLPQRYLVDDQVGVRQPLGMIGSRLEVQVNLVTASLVSAQNLARTIERAELEVDSFVFEPLACGQAVLTSEEMDGGVALIDLGSDGTDVGLYFDGALAHTSFLPLGSRHITNDLAVGLRVPPARAEELKQRHGSALATRVDPEEVIQIPGIEGRRAKEISRSVVASIIQPRIEEIFGLAAKQMRRTSYAEPLPGGVVLTGGGALLEGVCELAERMFDLPVRIGIPQGFTGLVERAAHPRHATGIGLVLYAARSSRRQAPLNRWQKLTNQVKKIWKEYF